MLVELSFDFNGFTVAGVVVDVESDSFSKLPAAVVGAVISSNKGAAASSPTVFDGNTNCASFLRVGEKLKSDWLDDDEFGDPARDSCFGFGSIPFGNCKEFGGRYTRPASKFEDIV